MKTDEFMYEFWPKGRMEHPSQLLTLQERDRRWNKIRDEMKKRGLDCLICYDGPMGTTYSGVVRYITNAHGTLEGKMIFPLKGNPVILYWAEMAQELLERTAWPGVDLQIGGPGVPTWGVANLVKDLGYEKATIGVVGLSDYTFLEGWMQHTSYILLERFLPHAKLVDATTLITDAKATKSEEEIKLIEKASEIADKAIETMVMYAKPGIATQEVWARIMYTILSEGGDCGIEGSTHLMTIGDWHHQAHSLLTHNIIKEGDVILTEFYPKYGGYYSHPHQPVFIGKVHEDYEKCYPVLMESIQAGLEALTPEHTWMEIGEALAKPVRKAGMWGVQWSIHGLSMTMPDAPFAPMPGCERRKVDAKYPGSYIEKVPELQFIAKRRSDYLNRKVEANMALTIEPRAILGNRGLHMGPTVVTTEGYPRILTKYGRDVIRV